MAVTKKRNKRHGPDAVLKVINAIAIFSWIVIFTVFIVFSLAKPSIQGFGRGMSAIGGGWDNEMLSIILYLLLFQVLLSVLGLLFNTTRLKRKTDRLNPSLIFSGILAIVGIILYTLFS